MKSSFLTPVALFLGSLLWIHPVGAVNFLQSYQAALQQSENMAQKHEEVVQAKEQIRQARGAVMPNLAANASHFRQPLPSDPIARQFSPETQTTARLTLTQPIFRGFSEFAALNQTRSSFEAREQLKIFSKVQLYQDMAVNYFDILALEQDLKNLREQVDLYNQRVKDLQARTRRGESNVTEALTAQSTQASLEAEIQLVSGQLAAARERYAFLTGLPANSSLEDNTIEGQNPMPALKTVDDYLARVEMRPDIQAALKQAKAADSAVTVARGGHWPTVDAVGNYYLKRPNNFLSDIDWDVEVRLSLPIFEGGARQSQVREASSKKSVSELELKKLRRQAQQDIRSLYESLKVRLNQVSALEKTVGLAEKNYKVLQREFRNGLVRSIDAQVALTEFRTARRTYDRARYAAKVDLISLEAASYILPNEVTP